MKALIIYDDFAAATRASATLHQPEQCRKTGVQWNVSPWRLEMLKFPPIAGEVLDEAIDAHLIVFAGRCGQAIPSWLQNWLEHWAKCRRISDAALAVIHVFANDTPSASVGPELSRFATRHGLNLIFDGNLAGVASTTEGESSFAIGMKNEKPANHYWAVVPDRRNAVSVG